MRAVDIPPTQPTLDRRKERLLLFTLATTVGAPSERSSPHPEDDSSRKRIPRWFAAAAGHPEDRLIREGQKNERTSPNVFRLAGRDPHWQTQALGVSVMHGQTGRSEYLPVATHNNDGSGPALA